MSIHRLQGLYRTAAPVDVANGLEWYHVAGLEVRWLADKYHLEFGLAAGVVAVLSPGTSWEQNLADADQFLRGWRSGASRGTITVTTYGANREKAWRMVTEGRVFPHLRGPKVEPFYRNLCGDLDVPTIDSHAINAWHGRRVEGISLRLPKRTSTIRKISADYTRAAENRGITPAQFQAVIWLTWKRRVNQGLVPGYKR